MSKESNDKSAKHIRKITAKEVCADELKAVTKDVVLFNVYGTIRGLENEEGAYGPYTKLKGDFLAERISDGMTFRASIFLPTKPLDGILEAQYYEVLAQADQSTGEIPTVEFAGQVGLSPHDGKTGYTYWAKPLIDMRENDPLMLLREQALKKELPAPAKK